MTQTANKPEPFIINIGRSLGSGGRAIGHILAKDFGIAYYDREILNLAAKESGFCAEVFERNDEKNRFLRTLGNIIPFIGGGATYYDNELSNENLFRIQSEAIRKAAADHSCIFIGRCADYVLRDNPRCVNVFITANMEDRIASVMKWNNCTAEKAQEIIEKGDSERASFYNFYSSGTWGAASTYHLCINSSVLGIEETAVLIKNFVVQKLKLQQ
ncbi:cytidylate kinase-like family protein [uncultured Prevotellamassilia sp.]|uniref:cytidylate kinase-like family protein n=1 Tax=uncultured Prevotellamassilia sp. TaxID=1926676 RepID=UPI0025898A8A|nr:cytidylate kinase-like family protein [uncultured Prevotellamassilia sp.]